MPVPLSAPLPKVAAPAPDLAVPDHPVAVDECVEALCSAGCRKVHGYIALLEQGENFTEVAHLSPADRDAVHAQLKSVMQAYEGRCCED
jgi:hypothetical protein